MLDKDIIQDKLGNILIGRSVSSISKSGDFLLELNYFGLKNNSYPKLLFISLLSDWFIKELGTWESLNSLFPISTEYLSIPYDPIKSFYLLYITENRSISDVKFTENTALEINFDNEFTIVMPNVNEHNEYAWLIYGRNLRISYNADEQYCYYEED